MFVSLPMYDLESLKKTTDAWWTGLRKHLLDYDIAVVSETLSRPDDLISHWCSDDLLLSQTCGYPLTHALKNRVQYLANPVYNVKGCDGAYYRSALIVRMHEPRRRIEDFKSATLAINGEDSQSGYHCLCRVLPCRKAVENSFSEIVVSGSHLNSLKAVRDTTADICAIDCVTLGLAAKHEPALLEGLRLLDWTPPTPGLPLITSLSTSDKTAGRITQALKAAVNDDALSKIRNALMIKDFVAIDEREFFAK